MQDAIREVTGNKATLTLTENQRIVIETAHGFIQITVARGARGGNLMFNLVLPDDLVFRKGPILELTMATKFLRVDEEGAVKPAFSLLGVHQENGSPFRLSEVSHL